MAITFRVDSTTAEGTFIRVLRDGRPFGKILDAAAFTSANWLQTLTAGSGALSAVGISLTAFAHTSTAAECSQRRHTAGRWRPARQR